MEPIKILGINASPRKKGNSHFLLDIALDSARELAPDHVETELYETSGKLYKPVDRQRYVADFSSGNLDPMSENRSSAAKIPALWM